MLLIDTIPEFSAELRRLLKEQGHGHLIDQLPGLQIVDRCRCGDDFCSSFYTQPKPLGTYGAGLKCIELNASEGMIILDVVDGVICHVEVLYRDDVQKKLFAALP